jgi:hypothetical protein
MFKSITFFNQNTTDTFNPLDIGALVECMLFYGETSVIANQSILRQLFTYFGVDRVVELIEENLLNIIYTETNVGVCKQELGPVPKTWVKMRPSS